MEITWSELKNLIDTGTVSYRHVELSNKYVVVAFDDQFKFTCSFYRDTDESAEYEASYKLVGLQKSQANAALPFAAKTINGLKLYTRVQGIQRAVTVGVNNIDFLIPYNQVKFNGLELIGGILGDKCDLEILDTPTGLITTVPYYKLNQFGYAVNVGSGYYRRESQYDADLIKDMTIRIKYTSTVVGMIYVNYLIHELKV